MPGSNYAPAQYRFTVASESPNFSAVRLMARARLAPPQNHRGGGGGLWAAQARLAPVRPPGGLQRRPGTAAAILGALQDAPALHVRDLGQDRQDQLADAAGDRAEAAHFDRHALVEEPPDGGLDVQRIAAQAVDRVDADRVALANHLQELREARPVSSLPRLAP